MHGCLGTVPNRQMINRLPASSAVASRRGMTGMTKKKCDCDVDSDVVGIISHP